MLTMNVSQMGVQFLDGAGIKPVMDSFQYPNIHTCMLFALVVWWSMIACPVHDSDSLI